MFDTDHSGEIDEDEFAMLLEYLGIELTEEEMEKMFHRIDEVCGCQFQILCRLNLDHFWHCW
jgi:Ca2+-binding EF-hand superfamily protein